jgi:hypothetical protein
MDTGPLRPGKVFIIPFPPGTEPRLELRVESVSPTGWDGLPWAALPDAEGSGLDFREVFRSARAYPPTDPVRMRVVPMAGTLVARVTLDPFCFGDLSRYASAISFSLSWPSRGGGRPVRGTSWRLLLRKVRYGGGPGNAPGRAPSGAGPGGGSGLTEPDSTR